MLRNPELCGGINHVLKTYDEYAKTYLRLITDEIDSLGKPIDKVRAGYIISERLGIDNEIVNNWAKYAQREPHHRDAVAPADESRAGETETKTKR